MGILALLPSLFFLQAFLAFFASTLAAPNSTLLFSEYIGAESQGVKFSDLPINPNVEFHFILAFAVDYTPSNSLAQQHPTNGKFNIFWDTDNLRPSHVAAIKRRYENVKVALSLGGDSVDSGHVYFQPSSIDSWVMNAAFSLTKIIKEYDLDGIDIDYEHFSVDPGTFAECIGRLVTILKNNEVISFASIAPFEDDEVQSHYSALWRKYRHVIDYVNFQFYAYDRRTTVPQFLHYFESQRSRYKGGKILASFTTEGRGGLSPENGFFSACERLKKHGNLAGIFIWCADTSKQNDFRYEKQSQNLLESKH